jgi:hypothetical protein
MISRRAFVIRVTGIVAAGAATSRLAGQLPRMGSAVTPITIYKSSTCGCCTTWVEHVRAAGFVPTVFDEEDMDSIKDKLRVPPAVRSCHTAVVASYLIEGHVPASDIRRLLAEKPGFAGLAVPGMPPGTPGMAPSGTAPAGFDVVGFQHDGTTRTFARY